MRILIFLFIGFLLLSSGLYAADTKINRHNTVNNGRVIVNLTNAGAVKNQKYLNSLTNGSGYKNYKIFTPKKLEKIEFDPKPKNTPTPYSEYDVSLVANAHKVLGQIVVVMSDGSTMDISPIIMNEAKKNNIDPLLIKSIIKFESGFCPFAVSPVGAAGLMQLMPDTAAGLGVADLFSPSQNIAGGVLYVRRQLDAFNNNVAFALAAYNAGPGAVSAYGGVPPYAETINYVNGILADYARSGKSLKNRTPKEPPKTEEKRNIDIFSTLDRMRAKTAPAATTDSEGE